MQVNDKSLVAGEEIHWPQQVQGKVLCSQSCMVAATKHHRYLTDKQTYAHTDFPALDSYTNDYSDRLIGKFFEIYFFFTFSESQHATPQRTYSYEGFRTYRTS